MYTHLYDQLKELSINDENESVIAIRATGRLKVLKNISTEPSINFKVSYRELNQIKNLACLFHTHVKDDQPGHFTFDDIKGSKDSKTPFLMWHKIFDEWDYYDPFDINPYPLKPNIHDVKTPEHYTNWPFDWWRCDCYTIVRSYYEGVLGISLEDFERFPTEKVLQPSWNRFQENFKNQGFTLVRDLQIHDVLLMNIEGNSNGHHLAIYLGNDRILHVLKPKTVSKIDNLSHFKDNIVGVWRRC